MLWEVNSLINRHKTHMKVILYMAISANGMIAKENDNTSWISEIEWNSYSLAVRRAGCLIVGRRTYHILTKQPEFVKLKDIKLVVVSKEIFPLVAENHQIASSPNEAIEKLKDFEEIIVAGGGILNTSFIESNLVDEIYLDIEPIIFGKGIKIFNDGNFERKLELLGIKKLSSNEIQIHYKLV